MSNSNVVLVQTVYAAFGRGDIATIVKALSPDIDWTVNGPNKLYPCFGHWKGPGEVQNFFKLVAEHEAFSDFSPKEFHAAGDQVFAFGHYAGTVRKTGRSFACDWLHVFTVKDGKVTRFREFTDTAQFVDAYRG